MPTIKQKVSEIVQAQPDDISFDGVLRELAFLRMIERGLDDSRQARTIPNEEMEYLIRIWRS